MRIKHGCACLRSDINKAYPPCPSPRIPWRRLSDQVWDTFVQCIMGLDTLELFVEDKRQAWEKQKANMERQIKEVREQLSKLQHKRRQYSWQQAEGIITDEELLAAHRQLRSEESILNGQLRRLEEFSGEPSPPDRATFEKLAAYWRGAIVGELDAASDELRAKFAELFDLYITIHPEKSSEDYRFGITANIPLEMEGNAISAYDMVFNPWRGGLKGVRLNGNLYTGRSIL